MVYVTKLFPEALNKNFSNVSDKLSMLLENVTHRERSQI